jgi:hypothetical protein
MAAALLTSTDAGRPSARGRRPSPAGLRCGAGHRREADQVGLAPPPGPAPRRMREAACTGQKAALRLPLGANTRRRTGSGDVFGRFRTRVRAPAAHRVGRRIGPGEVTEMTPQYPRRAGARFRTSLGQGMRRSSQPTDRGLVGARKRRPGPQSAVSPRTLLPGARSRATRGDPDRPAPTRVEYTPKL